ncbi:MAG: hypothetical protein E7Z67_04010 [Thermoplasmata archaeon]|nr:hypothetical protein [Thermoplasmata archaeon]
MNAKMKATIAVAVVAMMVFAAAGATTYSWFSETEETDVTINTGKIVIDGQFQIGGLTVNGNGDFTSLSAKPTATLSGTSITVINAIDKLNIPVTYTLTNTSSVDAFWRFYTSLPDGWAIDKVKVANGSVDSVSRTGLVYLAGGEFNGMQLEPVAAGSEDTIVVTFNIVANNPEQNTKYEFKFVSEAYQFGYNYSAPASLSAGKVTLGDVAGKDVKVEGLTSPVAGVNPVPVVMEFEASTGNTIAGKTLSITNSVQTDDDNFVFEIGNSAVALDIDLSDPVEVDGIVPLNGYVTITVPIPGNVPEPTVVYTGNPDEKITVVDARYVEGEGVTYVTFKTNHFSEYVIGDFEAKIGQKYYSGLKDATNAVTSGETVYLLKDIVETLENDGAGNAISYLTVSKSDVTFNLNGHDISMVASPTATRNYGVFTISDCSNVTFCGNGTISLEHSGVNMEWNALSAVLNIEKATVSINGPKISHLGGTDMAYGVDIKTNGGSMPASAVLEDGQITSTYRGVRMFINGEKAECTFTVNNGRIFGDSAGIWMQYPSEGKHYGDIAKLTINGGIIEGGSRGIYIYGSNSTATPQLTVKESAKIIANGSDGYAPLTISSIDGSWYIDKSMVNLDSFVNKVGGIKILSWDEAIIYEGDRITFFRTLPLAIESIDDAATVVLNNDASLSDKLVINKEVVIDLNGYSICQTKKCDASYDMIENKGRLTITDSVGTGKISFTDTSAGDPNFGWGSYTIHNRGTLIVNGGTIEHLGEQEFAKHMICAIQQSSGEVTINGGTISTPAYRSVRINAGHLTINGGEFDGQVWLQPNQGNVTIKVTGGTFAPNGNDGSSIFMENAGEKYTVSSAEYTGGTFTTKIGCSDSVPLSSCITGGYFTESAINGTNEALINKDYEFTEPDSKGFYELVLTQNS